ncbi:ABC transporter ATP-binding protein [Avrilella dinanensis]|uniref:ABC transporter n=1 Tax=Avrilella dinanensis TaxID=2008672 RepID=A0A2M9R6P2_9FLAO|nr:ABC transporter ATP-binding protein [Avrilella dinanensis]PJR04445.1 ABC transporter [Avrilella dinanensis]
MKELKELNKYFWKYRYRLFIGILITIVAQIFMVMTPGFIGDAISVLQKYLEGSMNADQVKSDLIRYILLIIGATVIGGFLTFLMRQTIIVMSRHIEYDLKNEIFRHYQNLSQSFYKRNRTGDLMSRISEDVSKVRQYVGPAVMYSTNTIIRMAIVIVQMLIISRELTMYALIPVPFLGIVMYYLSREINKKSYLYQKNLSTLSSFSQEIFSGIRVVKAYAIEDEKNKEYDDLTTHSKETHMNLVKVSSLIGPAMIFLIGLSNLFVVYVGAKMYIDGTITDIGIIAQFILYINILTWPIASLGWISSMIQEAESSQKRINEFLNETPEIKNLQPEHTKVQGEIEFKNVSFTYTDTQIQALKNVSFTLSKNETLAILGKTGSGKSTILELICRLYDADNGEILIDNQSIKSLNLYDLRDAIAMVPQDAFLFSDSIKSNIRFGKEDATEEEVRYYAQLADVDKNIMKFDKQYDTVLGERGITLSGGQKQRVSIARALIKEAPILLLDDSLSAVDTETEERILNNLKNITANRTTIIVTHRVSSAKNADRIIILEEGKIVEKGTHDELINAGGYYQDLYNKQLLEKEIK